MLGHCAQSVGGALPGVLGRLKPELIFAAQTGDGAANAQRSIDVPAHQRNDLILCIAALRSNVVATPPTGFLNLETSIGNDTSTPANSRSIAISGLYSEDGSGRTVTVGSTSAMTVLVLRNALPSRGVGMNRSGTIPTNSVGSFVALPLAKIDCEVCSQYLPSLTSVDGLTLLPGSMAAFGESGSGERASRNWTASQSILPIGIRLGFSGGQP